MDGTPDGLAPAHLLAAICWLLPPWGISTGLPPSCPVSTSQEGVISVAVATRAWLHQRFHGESWLLWTKIGRAADPVWPGCRGAVIGSSGPPVTRALEKAKSCGGRIGVEKRRLRAHCRVGKGEAISGSEVGENPDQRSEPNESNR